MNKGQASHSQGPLGPPSAARFNAIFNVHTLETPPPDQWRRLIRACRLGHLGAIEDLARWVDDPIAHQVAADSLILHGRPDLAMPIYEQLISEASQNDDASAYVLRARLGLAAVHLLSGNATAALADADLAMAACFELAVLDDYCAWGYHLNTEVGEYIGEFPLQWTAATLIDHPNCTAALRARLGYFLFLAGGSRNKLLLRKSFAVLQAPEQFFWIAQEHYWDGEFALGLEREIRYAQYACDRGGIPQLCCMLLDDDPDNTDWTRYLSAVEASRLLDLAVPMILSTNNHNLVQALAPFFTSGGLELLRRAGRLSDVVAVVDRLDATVPAHA
jgi:hypothetical protein